MEVMKSTAGLGFQHHPRDLANVNALKTMFDPYIKYKDTTNRLQSWSTTLLRSRNEKALTAWKDLTKQHDVENRTKTKKKKKKKKKKTNKENNRQKIRETATQISHWNRHSKTGRRKRAWTRCYARRLSSWYISSLIIRSASDFPNS